ncbi:MAG: PIN domain nuclease [Actinomycetota bacterium]
MILPDTSAWIDLFNDTGHPTQLRLVDLLTEGREVMVTEPVVMEVLAGMPGPALSAAQSSLRSFRMARVNGLADFEDAAAIFRACRAGGETPRSLVDCLIAAVAIREGASVLHRDADFDVIARHTTLRIEPVD